MAASWLFLKGGTVVPLLKVPTPHSLLWMEIPAHGLCSLFTLSFWASEVGGSIQKPSGPLEEEMAIGRTGSSTAFHFAFQVNADVPVQCEHQFERLKIHQ